MFNQQNTTNQLYNHAVNLHRSGRYPQAVESYRQLLRQFPSNPDILDKLGAALTAMGRPDEGRTHLERALKLAPNQPIIHHDLHLTYKWQGRFEEAHACLDKALKLAPRHPVFSAAKAELHHMTGEPEDALRTIEPILGQAPDVPALALVFGTIAHRVEREAEAVDVLRALLEREDVPPQTRIKCLFTLGFLLDRLERLDDAFEAYQRASVLKNASFDIESHRQKVDAVIAAWTPEALAATPTATVDGSRCVFVVGMPRSGEWLVERAIRALPGGAGGGERNDLLFIARDLQGEQPTGLPMVSALEGFTPESVQTLAEQYLQRTAAVDGEATRVVDRLSMNFANLQLVNRLLPGARVIHCTQDPMDACFSCWTTHFAGHLPFTYDLATLGRFHGEYQRLMDHWRSVLDTPMLEVSYEDLVRSRDTAIRSIADFVDLPWDDAALSETGNGEEPDRVARAALERAIGRAELYGDHLAPLRDALAE